MMDFEISKMIRWMMCVISLYLKDGWSFKIIDKNIDGLLFLDDKGFCVVINGEIIYVTPMYVIDLLVRSYLEQQDEFVYYSKKSFLEINYRMSSDKVINSPSWVRIVYFIKRVENSYREDTSNGLNFDFISFKNYLKCFNNTFYQDIINELASLSEKELTVLSNIKPALARKIESLYYVEALMIKYLESEIEDEIDLGVIEKQKEDIDIDDYRVGLMSFFKIIKYRNDENVLKSDLLWLSSNNLGKNDSQKSLLGLDDRVLPSSIEATIALKNYNQRKKWMSN